MRFISAVVLIAFTLTACGGGGSETPAEKAAAAKKADASATFACRNFHNMASDVNDGLLNDAELRKAVKKIQDDGRLSETPGIEADSTRLLATITTGNADDFLLAVSDLNDSCKAAGA